MVVEEHPTLLNITMHPTKVGKEFISTKALDGSGNGGGEAWHSLDFSNMNTQVAAATATVNFGDLSRTDALLPATSGFGGDRGEIGSGPPEPTLEENSLVENIPPRWHQLPPYTFYNPSDSPDISLNVEYTTGNSGSESHIRVTHGIEDITSASTSAASVYTIILLTLGLCTI